MCGMRRDYSTDCADDQTNRYRIRALLSLNMFGKLLLGHLFAFVWFQDGEDNHGYEGAKKLRYRGEEIQNSEIDAGETVVRLVYFIVA